MAESAIGLIETQGLVGVIEAADTAAKAADVQLLGIERIGGGLVSLRLCGDVASVQAAVQAAAEAVSRVSELVSAHVIPQPHVDVAMMSSVAPLGGVSPRSPDVGPVSDAPNPSDAPQRADVEPLPDLQQLSPSDLGHLSVARLRQLVRRTPGVQLRGRQISRANKEELVAELLAAAGRDLGR
ncbi:MAG TPA: BMC domain-containing protein [Candidatus Latescibacteria bacterium]|nr:BMC domain-containing protein [Candidatus Latescibacterota bacterium]